MIQITIAGNLGKDATVNDVNDKSVINFSVAHSEKYKDAQGNQKEKTIWVECAYWVQSTGIAPYLKKGTTVVVTGQPDIRTYESNGKTGASLQCRVHSVQLLGGSSRNENTPTAQQATQQPTGGYSENEPPDSLPF